VRRTREAEVACVIKEGPDGTWRVSLRSVGDVDVCRIAEHQGGGGHRFAAGFTSDDAADVVVARILAAL
jgi:phosphoesterase RecJ-like protein